jgi:hypothetical protein
MKAYIQDLCGDEDTVVIDCAILQCMLQEAIFEKLTSNIPAKYVLDEINKAVYEIIGPYIESIPSISIDFKFPRKGDHD